jgi:hypothetical protein
LEVVGVRGWQYAGKFCLLQQSQYGGWLLGQPEDSKTLAAQLPKNHLTSSPPSHGTFHLQSVIFESYVTVLTFST